jgi:hypothetical protein
MLFHTIKSGHKIVVNIFSTPLVQKLRQEGNTAVIDFNQLKQKQSVIAYASIPEYHWGVAVMQPVHFSKVLIARDRQLMELLTGYGIILLLAVLTVILTKRVASTHQRAKGDALIMESEERYRALITGMPVQNESWDLQTRKWPTELRTIHAGEKFMRTVATIQNRTIPPWLHCAPD